MILFYCTNQNMKNMKNMIFLNKGVFMGLLTGIGKSKIIGKK